MRRMKEGTRLANANEEEKNRARKTAEASPLMRTVREVSPYRFPEYYQKEGKTERPHVCLLGTSDWRHRGQERYFG